MPRCIWRRIIGQLVNAELEGMLDEVVVAPEFSLRHWRQPRNSSVIVMSPGRDINTNTALKSYILCVMYRLRHILCVFISITAHPVCLHTVPTYVSIVLVNLVCRKCCRCARNVDFVTDIHFSEYGYPAQRCKDLGHPVLSYMTTISSDRTQFFLPLWHWRVTSLLCLYKHKTMTKPLFRLATKRNHTLWVLACHHTKEIWHKGKCLLGIPTLTKFFFDIIIIINCKWVCTRWQWYYNIQYNTICSRRNKYEDL